jgi:hypothetical protein
MKIVIGGSMVFAKEQIEIQKILVDSGHEVFLTDDIEEYVDKPSIKSSFEEELKVSLEYDIMRSFFDKIAKSDAFLVCNNPKNGISGYLGTSVLMELGLAYYLGKKIYLLNDIDRLQGYALEVAIIDPIILNGDIALIAKA